MPPVLCLQNHCSIFMKILQFYFALISLATAFFFSACNSSREKSNNPKISLADSLKSDTSFCRICRDTTRVKSKTDSLACNQFCGNWQDTTNTSNVNSDGYFDLLLDGVSYHFPYAMTQRADGWKYGAAVTYIPSSGFAIQGDVLKQSPTINRFQFHFNFEEVTGPGTYVIAEINDTHPLNFVTANLNPTGVAVPDFFSTATLLDCTINQRRVKNPDGDCDATDLPLATHTLVITKWGPAGTIIEGTISGTLHENLKTATSCKDSEAFPYQGSFKIRRIM